MAGTVITTGTGYGNCGPRWTVRANGAHFGHRTCGTRQTVITSCTRPRRHCQARMIAVVPGGACHGYHAATGTVAASRTLAPSVIGAHGTHAWLTGARVALHRWCRHAGASCAVPTCSAGFTRAGQSLCSAVATRKTQSTIVHGTCSIARQKRASRARILIGTGGASWTIMPRRADQILSWIDGTRWAKEPRQTFFTDGISRPVIETAGRARLRSTATSRTEVAQRAQITLTCQPHCSCQGCGCVDSTNAYVTGMTRSTRSNQASLGAVLPTRACNTLLSRLQSCPWIVGSSGAQLSKRTGAVWAILTATAQHWCRTSHTRKSRWTGLARCRLCPIGKAAVWTRLRRRAACWTKVIGWAHIARDDIGWAAVPSTTRAEKTSFAGS